MAIWVTMMTMATTTTSTMMTTGMRAEARTTTTLKRAVETEHPREQAAGTTHEAMGRSPYDQGVLREGRSSGGCAPVAVQPRLRPQLHSCQVAARVRVTASLASRAVAHCPRLH